MSTKTLLEINHDYANHINADSDFLLALAEYLARPSQMAADLLSQYGVRVYGTCHSDDTQTRGYRDPHYDCGHKVTRVA